MTVNMTKGQAISLRKSDGNTLTAVRMGLGWQAATRRGLFGRRARQIDLDASAVLFAGEQPVDVVFFRHLVSDDGSVKHTGDNLVGGAGSGGDDEAILVDLSRVPSHVDQIVFTVNSFTGQTFQQVKNAFCRIVDETTGQETARYTLDGGGDCTAQIMAKVHRGMDGEPRGYSKEPSPGGWRMTALGIPAKGRTFQDLIPSILPHL
ncbi:export associated protein [Streptomyces inusitatus]|uniref:Export associated protein n=1 Tax=Streptomyces inusitatus TaxID=68221 RepID=A0A918QDJ4_9ACTN|nr:TerD family protein [Streptomyces inusitatus]GGZ43478.1 export associated protein [Streptomyces inusitatus]